MPIIVITIARIGMDNRSININIIHRGPMETTIKVGLYLLKIMLMDL